MMTNPIRGGVHHMFARQSNQTSGFAQPVARWRGGECNGIKLTRSCQVCTIHKVALSYISSAFKPAVTASVTLAKHYGYYSLFSPGFRSYTCID